MTIMNKNHGLGQFLNEIKAQHLERTVQGIKCDTREELQALTQADPKNTLCPCNWTGKALVEARNLGSEVTHTLLKVFWSQIYINSHNSNPYRKSAF